MIDWAFWYILAIFSFLEDKVVESVSLKHVFPRDEGICAIGHVKRDKPGRLDTLAPDLEIGDYLISQTG